MIALVIKIGFSLASETFGDSGHLLTNHLEEFSQLNPDDLHEVTP